MAKPSTKHITALNYGIQALESAKSNTVKNEQVRMLDNKFEHYNIYVVSYPTPYRTLNLHSRTSFLSRTKTNMMGAKLICSQLL